MSPGSSSTGSRFTVASAAPVTRFIAPGPMEAVTARRGPPPGVLGVPDGGVHQSLLVAALDERHHLGELVQRLAQPGHVAMTEDAQGGRDQPASLAIGDRVLPGQVGDHRLRDGQPNGGSGHE